MVNISMLIISTIWFTFDLSVSSVPRPCMYMLGSSSLTQVFCMCKTVLHPLYVNVKPITPDHHMVLRNDELSQRCKVRGEHFLEILMRDHLIYYRRSKQIRCINMINITCNQNMWHDMAIIILCFWSPSPKHRHDLHRHRLDTFDLHRCVVVVSPTIASTTIANAYW